MTNRYYTIVLGIILSFPIATAFCVECNDTTQYPDWRASLGPIRDQDSVGWCYAFTAADIVTDYLHRNPSFRPTELASADFTKKENMVSSMPGAVAVENGSVKMSSGMSMGHTVDPNFSYDDVLKNNKKLEEAKSEYETLCNGDCRHDCLYSYVNNLDYSYLNCHFFESRSADLPNIVRLFNKVQELDKKQRENVSQYSRLGMGGNAELIIESYLKNGISLESQFPSDNFTNEDQIREFTYDFAYVFGQAESREEALCCGYDVFKEICPNCTQSFEDIKPILEKSLNPQYSALYEITNNDIFKFKIKETSKLDVKQHSYSSEIPWSSKQKDIDKGLKEGIVGIGYDVANLVSLGSGGHASTLVGKKCIKGEEHYILRNSWGQQSCESIKKEIILHYVDNMTENKNAIQEYSACVDKCNTIVTTVESFFLFPTEDPQKVLEKEECKNNCYNKNKSVLENTFDTYLCDEQGYYYIKSDKLLDAVSSVQYIHPEP